MKKLMLVTIVGLMSNVQAFAADMTPAGGINCANIIGAQPTAETAKVAATAPLNIAPAVNTDNKKAE